MMHRKVLICLGFYVLIFYQQTIAQNDDALIANLIKEIATTQISKDGEFYAGMFPSFRECGGAPHNYQPDNNIFYSAVIAFALQKTVPHLQGENKKTVTDILQKIQKVYPYYQNKDGLPYYGFWPLNGTILPHSFIFKYLKGVFAQGEDADDSVIILLTDNSNDSTAAVLKKRLIAVSNLATPKRKIISTYKKYRKVPAYSTYLGTLMTADFDFAVQCNIMYFMLEKKLPFTKEDSATLFIIADMVKNRKHMTSPTYISPYYVHSSILLYHISRLMGAFKIPELEMYKAQLIKDIYEQLNEQGNIMDQIILRTSLLRLGAKAPPLEVNSLEEFKKSNQSKFVFFQARAAFSYPTPFKQILLHWSYLYYLFYCEAYNKVLWLEYLVEKRKANNLIV